MAPHGSQETMMFQLFGFFFGFHPYGQPMGKCSYYFSQVSVSLVSPHRHNQKHTLWLWIWELFSRIQLTIKNNHYKEKKLKETCILVTVFIHYLLSFTRARIVIYKSNANYVPWYTWNIGLEVANSMQTIHGEHIRNLVYFTRQK